MLDAVGDRLRVCRCQVAELALVTTLQELTGAGVDESEAERIARLALAGGAGKSRAGSSGAVAVLLQQLGTQIFRLRWLSRLRRVSLRQLVSQIVGRLYRVGRRQLSP